ncbi:MAG: DUF362 domain-containing protein [Deltaproteobacteria bacterium]|nr:DUF362 domain-containing protein [Deltaproteobacteria bacterium]MBN2674803.1 DUF362 domain-containing protein [Deltaproteobacteria bacterium]
MSATVYYTPLTAAANVSDIQQISKQLLQSVVEQERISLPAKMPLKVHFGEQKNVTFIRPENYLGVIAFLNERNIDSAYMETCVLYGGQRYKKELHEKTAEKHGFTQLPIIFADGEHGEAYAEVTIGQRHFETFKVGKAFLDYNQMIVLSHFKGHMLAGFGGAIKQLSMGYASKGGKLAMHMGEKPHIVNRKCIQCSRCTTRCAVDALHIGDGKRDKSGIDHSKCVGCGACVAICPSGAVSLFSVKSIAKFMGIGNPFIEKVVEGALAAQKHQQNIYLNFAMNITPGCDCEAKKMKPLMEDVGIFASTDPVAIDKACYDMIRARGKKFRGGKTFAYAEQIGLGSQTYALHEVPHTFSAHLQEKSTG